MSSNVTERGVSEALGSIDTVNANTSIRQVVTVTGTGLGSISIDDILTAFTVQNNFLADSSVPFDQLYIHSIHAYGVTSGYLSLAPYSHRQYTSTATPDASPDAQMWNNYCVNGDNTTNEYGSLTQLYKFSILGSTRPELSWTYANDEVTNNPFLVAPFFRVTPELQPYTFNTTETLACKVQSVDSNGDAAYFVQFDVTVRKSKFIPIATAFGAAAFGSENVPTDNYKRPNDRKKAIKEGEAAHELANKKRKVKIAKDLQMPTLDAH